MKGKFFRIMIVAALAGSLLSCRQEGKIIPRGRMCRIYQEMFLADAWLLNSDVELREKSDSTAFYEPIFKSFGYTTEDYLRSVEHYLQDPDRFSKMMLKVRDNLDAELKRLQEQQQAVPKEEMGQDLDFEQERASR